jgi:hypothetical protein
MSRIPPDAREVSTFEIVKGLGDTAFRMEYQIKDLSIGAGITTGPAIASVGEPLRVVSTHAEYVYPVNDADLTALIVVPLAVGHVVGVNAANLTTANATVTNPKLNDKIIGISFNDYSNDGSSGQPSSFEAGSVAVLMGKFIARISKAEWFLGAGKVIYIDGTHGSTVNLVYVSSITPGLDVVVVNWAEHAGELAGNGVAKYTCLSGDYATRYAGANPTIAEMALDRSVVGKVVKVDGDDIYVEFSI